MSQQTIEINLNRIEFLLKMFNFSKESLLEKLNEGYAKKLNDQDIFTKTIYISHLKRIDGIFKQGLPFYTDPIDLSTERHNSIFFRKTNFNADLNLSDYQTVNKIEKEISHLSVLTTLSNYPTIERTLPRYPINHCPQETAEEMRRKIYPGERFEKDKDFLEALINNLADEKVLVMEFLETSRNKKMSIDGFFIAPHYIAIKRQQKNSQQAGNLQDDNFKREIFTLAHELGHYLLGEEELDQPVGHPQDTSDVEKWCNAFAFAFLMGSENIALLNSIESPALWDSRITKLSQGNHISRLALFTNLIINKKISQDTYRDIKESLAKKNKAIQMEKEKKRAEEKDLGIESIVRSSKSIHSKLEKAIYRNAFFEGVIEEYEILSHFKIKKIDRLIYE